MSEHRPPADGSPARSAGGSGQKNLSGLPLSRPWLSVVNDGASVIIYPTADE